MLQNDKQTVCSEFRKLIVRAQWESLEAEEARRLEVHLQSCPSCQAFQRQIKALPEALQTRPNLDPEPAIRERLLRAFQTEQRAKQTFPKGVRFVKSLLTYRIPVYQLALFVLLAIGFWQWKSERPPVTRQAPAPKIFSEQLRSSQGIPPKLKSHLQIMRKLNGSLSAKDDSTLMRFVVSTM